MRGLWAASAAVERSAIPTAMRSFITHTSSRSGGKFRPSMGRVPVSQNSGVGGLGDENFPVRATGTESAVARHQLWQHLLLQLR
jgi:hypothetical protein